MKKITWVLGMLLLFSFTACGQGQEKVNEKPEIHWLTFEQVEQKMKEHPKKVLVDLYTSWCGWCKVMDKKTYSNPQLIQYVNEHFYAVKFNAEQKEPVQFLGQKWEYVAKGRANALAIKLMNGRMSYPTTVIMEDNFENPQPIPGYLEVNVMEGILKYFGEGANRKMPWNEFQHSFKPEWKM